MKLNISSVEGKRKTGFTLIEMLLVLVIISMFIVMGVRYVEQQAFNTRVERTIMQMQQILNASLSYYVANGSWPPDIATLQSGGYLPASLVNSPFGSAYVLTNNAASSTSITPVIYVWTSITAGKSTVAAANVIASGLPLAYATASGPFANPLQPCTNTAACYVVSSVNIPGQNLNNASAVNYAGLYHNGACVPAPQCPVDAKTGNTMLPEIMAVPVSVSGVNDYSSSGTPNIYPISSFTAYASALTLFDGTTGPAPCKTNINNDSRCYADMVGTILPINVKYWRVCLEVITEKGLVNPTDWGQYATILAITRCGIKNEPSGAGFQVWTQ